jgi:hypothetical protein
MTFASAAPARAFDDNFVHVSAHGFASFRRLQLSRKSAQQLWFATNASIAVSLKRCGLRVAH